MAEIKISDLTPKGANLIATDLLVISEDIGGGLYETKSITGDEVLNAVAKTAVAVRNQTGATIYKGTIVYISGASGGKALISKAQANSEATSSKTLGVVTADIANNANGNVLTNGLLTLLDTRTTATHPFTADTLTIGDDLYLSPTNAGYVTNVKPIAPNNLVNIGKVLETSSTTGQILYAIVNGYELGELHDVDTTGAVTGNVLALDGSVWKPTTISSGLTIGVTPISSGVAGRVLFEGAGNVMQEDSAFFWDNTNKRLGIGATPATNARLDIRAQGALSTDLVQRLRNSADTATLFEVRGDGNIALFQPGLYAANMKIFGPGGLTIAQFQNEVFGSIALGSGATFDALTYANVALGYGANTTGGSNSIAIGLNARAGNTANISIGADSKCTGQYGIKIGRHTGASSFGGLNSIHLGRTNSGNNVEPDNVFMTYFNSQSSSTLTRSNGSFGLLGQQAYILGNGTGTYGLDRFMGDGGNTFVVRNHTSIPSTNIIDSFQQYSADIIAGNAAPHFRTEDGSIIKLYKQDLPTNPTNAEIATLLSNLGLANLI